MRIKPSEKASEIVRERAACGLPLTQDQYTKLMHSARLADERLERKERERKAEREARS